MESWVQLACLKCGLPAAEGEDEETRNTVVAELFASATTWTGSANDVTQVPPLLMQFWDTAFVPDDVQACLDSWDQLSHNSGISRMLFNDHSAFEFIQDELTARHARAFTICGHPAMRCDYFRLCYLERKGGVYVDADERYLGGLGHGLLVGTSLKLQPLCYDIETDLMIPAAQFMPQLNAEAVRSARTYYVNNNPMVAPPGHPIVSAALERATRRLEEQASRGRPRLGIQSTTGPGNLTAALVSHAVTSASLGAAPEVALMSDWDDVSVSQWPLAYRADERNWRLWTG